LCPSITLFKSIYTSGSIPGIFSLKDNYFVVKLAINQVTIGLLKMVQDILIEIIFAKNLITMKLISHDMPTLFIK
jgi:hypothetical protein